MKITTGIPQGSSLGSTLFGIYINDISRFKTLNEIILYADDNALTQQGKNTEEVMEALQEKLDNLNIWFNNNNMEINEKKSVLMIFHRKNSKYTKEIEKINVTINGKKIKQQENCKYLGTYLDSNLKWEKQIKEMGRKVKALIALTYKRRNLMNDNIKKIYYHALIESNLAYSILSWSRGGKGNLKRIQKKQDTILRILYNKARSERIDEIYAEKKIMKINQLIITKTSKKAWTLLRNREIGVLILRETMKDSNLTLRKSSIRRIVEQTWKTNYGKMKVSRLMAKIVNHAEQKGVEIFKQKNRSKLS